MNVAQTFTVNTSSAGPGELSVNCQGPSHEIPVEVSKKPNKIYSCSYTPTESGEYSIGISWSDNPITNSPIRVSALAFADPNKCIITELPTGHLHVGTPYSFTVVTGQPGHEYNLAVSVKDKSSLGSCEIDCNSPTGICTVHFTPSEDVSLVLEVTCNGTSIPQLLSLSM